MASAVRQLAPERDTPRVNVRVPKCTRVTGNVRTPLRTNVELRCNPLLSRLPSRRPRPRSSRLPPAPRCSSLASRSAHDFSTALGWRYPPHPTPLTASAAWRNPTAGQISRFGAEGFEVVAISVQSEVSGLRFSIRTVEDLPSTGPCHFLRPAGTAIFQSRGASWHCYCQSPPTHRGTRTGWLVARRPPPPRSPALPRHPLPQPVAIPKSGSQ